MEDHSSARQLALELIYLARCAVDGELPERARIDELDLKSLYTLAEEQSMISVAASALEAAGVHSEDFTEARGKALRKAVLLDQDFRLLTRQLDEAGIWYMPLKGAILKDYYPRLGMRQMSDYDILYDERSANQVKKLMLALGYSVDEFNMHNVDSYEKPPVYRFELHRKLFSPYLDDRLYAYYRNVKDRLIPDEGSTCGYHFRPEDFYLYLIAHEFKHYMTGGNGLRFLMDTYVYLRKFDSLLDRSYIEEELGKLGLQDFECKNRLLTAHLFDGAELTPEETSMLDYMLSSGTFGTVDQAVQNQIERLGGGSRGKWRFIRQRLLIPMKTVESAYPFFYRHKLLIPFLYPYRLWKGIFRSREKILAEFRALRRKE